MEADWSVALGADDPVITVPWAACGEDALKCRFVDLRLNPHLIEEIEEARGTPALRSALLLLNGADSPLWTAKCDAWTTGPEQGDAPFDPYEMDAEPRETAFGSGSYIDLLPRDFAKSACFEVQERWLRAVTQRLRAIPARAARVELVLRRAQVDASAGYGVSWFLEGCGATAQGADRSWSQALHAALATVIDVRLELLRCSGR